LLRHPAAVSPAEAFHAGTSFRPVLVSRPLGDQPAASVVFCSGKIAYDLEMKRAEHRLKDVAIVRIEQLAPFPEKEIAAVVKQWASAKPVFLQEEPENMGALENVRPRLEAVLRDAGWRDPILRVVARKASASPAGSFHGLHEDDQAALVDRALYPGDASGTGMPPQADMHPQPAAGMSAGVLP